MLDALPEVAREEDLALHGGTAINLFVRDMPRLSVDIDLTYVPIAERIESFSLINEALRSIEKRLKARMKRSVVRLQEQQLKLQIELQDKAVSYEFSKHFPELFLTGNWLASAQENERAFNSWRYINSVYVGLNLKVPIFNGFQTTSKVQQAKIEMMKAEEEFSKTDQLFNNQLDNLLLRIKETKNKISAYDATIDEAQLGYDISVKRYTNGLGTQLENIDALVALTRAKINYLDAIFTYYELHANLEALLASEVKTVIQSD